MTGGNLTITLTPEQLKNVRRAFNFAWEKTVYRANLVALRTALGLKDYVPLPVDEELKETLCALKIDRGEK